MSTEVVKYCALCGAWEVKGKDLVFISLIKRDGSGVKMIGETDEMNHVDDTTFHLQSLSLSNKTHIASEFNSYVVKLQDN